MKLTTMGVVVAAALILVPHGAPDAPEARAEPVAAPVAKVVVVADVIAMQGNAALQEIRADATRLAPPDLGAVRREGQPE